MAHIRRILSVLVLVGACAATPQAQDTTSRPRPLPVVVIEAEQLPTDFVRRRKLGIGVFITQAQIEARRPQQLTDLFRTVAGVRVYPGQPPRVRLRNQPCPPLVWLDGGPLGAGEFDLDNVSPYSLAAIEIYSSNVPPELTRVTGCFHGAIVLWTRSGT